MFSALAAIAPIAIASRVRSASQVGKTLVKAAVGLPVVGYVDDARDRAGGRADGLEQDAGEEQAEPGP